MPKIEAATVVQHHHMRRTALIQAGSELLANQGFDAVTPAAVGAIAGIARSSVYQYFPSTASLLLAIIDQAFPVANRHITDALASIPDPAKRVDAYVLAVFDYATGTEHRTLDAMGTDRLPPEVKDKLDGLHRAQYMPLVEALTELGIANVGFAASIIGSMVQAAVRAAKSGADPDAVRDGLLKALHQGPLS